MKIEDTHIIDAYQNLCAGREADRAGSRDQPGIPKNMTHSLEEQINVEAIRSAGKGVINLISYYDTIDTIANDETLDTVILPLGSVEQHSYHLPVGTDYMVIAALAEALAQRVHAYLLPAIPITTSFEHKGKKGSVTMSPKTLVMVLQDIILDLKGQGFRKFIVMIGHGGIFAAAPAIRELNAMYDDLQIIKLDSAATPNSSAMLDGDPKDEIHAGEKETSLVLYLYEHLVNKEKMKEADCIPEVPRDFLNYAPLMKLSHTGAWGRPSLATKEKGERIFNQMIDDYAAFIEKAFLYTERDAW